MAYYFPNQTSPELLKGLEVAESAGQNIPVTTAPPAPTNGYVVDKSLVPQENLPTMNDIYTAQYADERQRDFKNNFPYPSLSPSEFAARNQVHTLKTAWQQAQEGINALDPAQNADTISKLRQVQKDSSDAANILRNTAQAMGWNMKGMGADDSLALSTQLINMDRQRGMNELYNMPTTAAQKREYYEQMVRRGVAPHVARDVANLKGDEFREQNISRLIEGIGAYGSNGDGSLNEFGQMLAGKLYTEAPYQYGNIVNSFASPKELFNVNANMAQAEKQNQSAWDRAKLNAQNAWDISEARLKQNESHYAQDRQDKLNQQEWERNYKTNQFTLDQVKAFQKTLGAQLEEAYNVGLALYNGDKAKAGEFAEKYISRDIPERKGEKEDEKLVQARNSFNIAAKGIVDTLKAGDFENSKTLIETAKENLRDPNGAYAGHIPLDVYNHYMALYDFYEKVANGEIPVKDIDRYVAELQGRTYIGTTDEDMAAIMTLKRENPSVWRELIDNQIQTYRAKHAKEEIEKPNNNVTQNYYGYYGYGVINPVPYYNSNAYNGNYGK
ncbi:MAG: hypothetical protein IJU91_00965 [Selenomonadaceae bacterium]|nr:hypothetical protein [Selenomonadaceae bacterium]